MISASYIAASTVRSSSTLCSELSASDFQCHEQSHFSYDDDQFLIPPPDVMLLEEHLELLESSFMLLDLLVNWSTLCDQNADIFEM